MQKIRVSNIIRNYLWLISFILGGIGFLIVWKFLPHEREIFEKWQFIVKILIFIVVIMGVSLFPNKFKLRYLLICIPFFVYLGFIIPKMTFYFLNGPHMEPEYYTYLWSLFYPGLILSICFSYRMGGGTPGKCTKIALIGLILLFSGYLEILWFIVNPWKYEDMPSIPHIEIIIGFKPSYIQLIIFSLCHIPLLGAVIWAPLDKLYNKLLSTPE